MANILSVPAALHWRGVSPALLGLLLRLEPGRDLCVYEEDDATLRVAGMSAHRTPKPRIQVPTRQGGPFTLNLSYSWRCHRRPCPPWRIVYLSSAYAVVGKSSAHAFALDYFLWTYCDTLCCHGRNSARDPTDFSLLKLGASDLGRAHGIMQRRTLHIHAPRTLQGKLEVQRKLLP